MQESCKEVQQEESKCESLLDQISLTLEEVNFLGCDDNIMERKTRFNVLKVNEMDDYLTCTDAIYTFYNCSKRYIGWSSEIIEQKMTVDHVKKRNDGNGFFPTYAAQSFDIKLTYGYKEKYKRRVEMIIERIQELQMNIVLEWLNTDFTLCRFKNLSPCNSIMMIEISSNNYGFYLSLLTLKEQN